MECLIASIAGMKWLHWLQRGADGVLNYQYFRYEMCVHLIRPKTHMDLGKLSFCVLL